MTAAEVRALRKGRRRHRRRGQNDQTYGYAQSKA
jgi:hypothetical protein